MEIIIYQTTYPFLSAISLYFKCTTRAKGGNKERDGNWKNRKEVPHVYF